MHAVREHPDAIRENWRHQFVALDRSRVAVASKDLKENKRRRLEIWKRKREREEDKVKRRRRPFVTGWLNTDVTTNRLEIDS